MVGWNDIGKDIQHLILWNYVYNTKTNSNERKNVTLLTDGESVLNVYLSHRCFHILNDWEKQIIATNTLFYKNYVLPSFVPYDLSSNLKDRPFEHLINAYISHKCQNQHKEGVYEYSMGLTMFNHYVTIHNGKYTGYREKEQPTLQSIALICCQYGMGRLFRFIINNYDLNIDKSKLQWCIDYVMESGDIKTVSWMNDKYKIIPSKDSMDEVFLSGIYELTKLCINRFDYEITIQNILDSLKMNNLEPTELALKLNQIKIEDIKFDDSYIFELFSYGCIKSIRWGITHDKIRKEYIFDIFKTYIYKWDSSQTSLYNASLETLKVINLNSYNRVIDYIQD